ncbi:putative ATP-dependent helicase [Neospora caninum Liverpool]|uniref:Putative ATP-dependent helicase n=1 Tax=Neospora caninum (strain Liverpool) TaxID=572307 RepID=F0V7L3_NEOCL|nr:putative ATP-dependent helicase [Neospora caninum Liverpool]CBZ49704.1 putative ATP-dependent helicase [Neospora caninum Liverpool]|eukprot:XP_003879739.1 putative ATP-dependent helicase [Neospora caninum Liverpool]
MDPVDLLAVADDRETAEKPELQRDAPDPSTLSPEESRSEAGLQSPGAASFCKSEATPNGRDGIRETKKPAAFAALEPLRKGKRKRREGRQEKREALEQQLRLAHEQQMQQRSQDSTKARDEGLKTQCAKARKTQTPQPEGKQADGNCAKRKLAEENATASAQTCCQLGECEDRESEIKEARQSGDSSSPSSPSPPSSSSSSSSSSSPVTYAPLLATSQIRRSEEVERTRLALPAAEVESKFVSFSSQHRHPRRQEADDVDSDEHDGSVSGTDVEGQEDEEANNREEAGEQGKQRRDFADWRRRLELKEERTRRREKMMKTRRHADVICVSGETGSGKSTQIPQFLFEAGICYPTLHLPVTPSAATSASSPSSRVVSLRLKIGVTQPRRVAAVMVARRVAQELGSEKLVGYHIRHKSENLGPECRIKFMTDGVLLREIQRDFLCSEYACIIIDEAHERSVNTDLLIGLLSRVVKLRRSKFEAGEVPLPPLKLVIMSASMRAKDFTENPLLFCPPPALLSIPAKQFKVASFFSRRTPENYVDAAIKKCIQAHCKLPPGSILLFVTGREEVEEVVAALARWDRRRAERARRVRPLPSGDTGTVERGEGETEVGEESEEAFLLPEEEAEATGSGGRQQASDDSGDDEDGQSGAGNWKPKCDTRAEKGSAGRSRRSVSSWQLLDSESEAENESANDGKDDRGASALCSLSPSSAVSASRAAVSDESLSTEKPVSRRERRGEGSTVWRGAGGAGVRKKEENSESNPEEEPFYSQLTPIPLYAALPPREQLKAFRLPEDQERLVIVATNVAETSVTLPNVRYVIDTGREKRRVFASEDGGASEVSCVSRFQISFITQASALQRAGRAGRVGAGFCYRLYSSSVYEHIFEPSSLPAITTTPLDSLLLYMSNLARALAGARERLVALGALEPRVLPAGLAPFKRGQLASDGALHALGAQPPSGKGGEEYKCTRLGAKLADFPIPPRYAKMLLFALLKSRQLGPDCLALCCLLVGALSVGELAAPRARFTRPQGEKRQQGAATADHARASAGLEEDSDEDGDDEDEDDEDEGEANAKAPGFLSEEREKDATGYPWQEYSNDIDAYLWMCGAYCHAVHRGKFCRRFGLNAKKMKDVFLLGNQLAGILLPLYIRQASKSAAEGSAKKRKHDEKPSVLQLPLKPQPPSDRIRLALHACVLEGLVDHVAVLVEASTRRDLTGGGPAPSKSEGGYRTAELKTAEDGSQQLAFLHPSSNLAKHRLRPKLVVYNFILTTSRPFLRDCLAIDSESLSLCSSPLVRVGDFLEIPAPVYDPGRDAVVAWQKPMYTPLSLPLPAVEGELPETHALFYPTVACAFLEGKLFPKLAAFASSLIVAPQTALAGARTSCHALREFLLPLETHKLTCRKAFVQMWKEKKGFLLSEYIKLQRFADYKKIRELSDLWPPL